MSKVTLNNPVPDFELPSTGDKNISLSSLRGENVLIYFYPKDSTPGCTLEGQQFRDHIAEFEQLNTVILGVSRDSIKKHENFKSKQCFPFDLLSDEEETVCNLFGVIQLKKLYGREYMGIVRSTFLIDEQGVLREEWRGVKVKGHVEEVLTAIKSI
ncbi:thioredoxin-dependent thiol peroxidase [Methylophaga sp. OBS3]|uniref:thioredoxin-dependent thiol peroxidase n=1 Tax=Methylophaga sp. OBS3 TaxID=2991934 RepID=UPI0022573995|nr:thioredoxin-dependent thiol peroxidase [Methylophaga sp. OBS3]MCX4189021.1 thioredoxin-dependent thiol peroxidase [Methylophaga sp. OBS3]